MNSKKIRTPVLGMLLVVGLLHLTGEAPGQEVFIYRPRPEKKTLVSDGVLSVHGELFVHLQAPSSFPSFNDQSGETDRWNYGFRNFFFLTPSTTLIAQLVAHDDTNNRTKFDWHFSARQNLARNLVLVIGHDSNHDSDHASYLHGKLYYTNRNYIGAALPLEGNNFYVEPFIWFFHHSNQRTHLDLSGEKIKQELGLRSGLILTQQAILSLQIICQSDGLFYLGQAYSGDLILRIRLAPWFELSLGGSLWKDIETSPLGTKKTFGKLMWGISIPF
jgi:hypothetical protein